MDLWIIWFCINIIKLYCFWVFQLKAKGPYCFSCFLCFFTSNKPIGWARGPRVQHSLWPCIVTIPPVVLGLWRHRPRWLPSVWLWLQLYLDLKRAGPVEHSVIKGWSQWKGKIFGWKHCTSFSSLVASAAAFRSQSKDIIVACPKRPLHLHKIHMLKTTL